MRIKSIKFIVILVTFLSIFTAPTFVMAKATTKNLPTDTFSSVLAQEEYSVARSMLASHEQIMYDALKDGLTEIAFGNKSSSEVIISSTVIKSFGVKYIWTASELNLSTMNSSVALQAFYEQFDLRNIVTALLSDCPYELYWFDKTQGYVAGASMSTSSTKATVNELFIEFQVTINYQPSNYDAENPTIDTNKAKETQTVLDNANALIASAYDYTDYEKLLYYKNEICNAVSYDSSVVSSSYNGGYTNVWQMISVFDNDSSTNVVCEGYSKAFKYLCDNTDFSSSLISCHMVTGFMNGGGHMWNIVTMEDGKNYIVDVTNSDSGTVGQNGSLFLKGYSSGNVSSGYNINNNSYTYDDDIILLYGTNSFLSLSNTTYNQITDTIKITVAENLIYDGNALTVGTSATDIIYSLSSGSSTRYNWTINWYNTLNGDMSEKISYAPIDAGEYFVEIIATSKYFSSTTYRNLVKVIIEKSVLTIETVTPYGKVYDGNNKIPVSVTLSGIIGDDIVTVADSVYGEILSSNVGEYSKILIKNAILTGENAKNYELNVSSDYIDCNLITVEKATPTGELLAYLSGEDKPLCDMEFNYEFIGVFGETLTGIIKIFNANGDEVLPTDIFVKEQTYTYEFTPDNVNYSIVTGDLKVGLPQQPNTNNPSVEDNINGFTIISCTSSINTIEIINIAIISLVVSFVIMYLRKVKIK